MQERGCSSLLAGGITPRGGGASPQRQQVLPAPDVVLCANSGWGGSFHSLAAPPPALGTPWEPTNAPE